MKRKTNLTKGFCLFKERETFVEQTPRAIFTDNVSQWSIFDAYNEDFDQQVRRRKNNKVENER